MAIRTDIMEGRWQLTESQYEFYSVEAARWLGMPAVDSSEDVDAISRAEAFAWLWQNRSAPQPAGRRLVDLQMTKAKPALVIWSRSSDETLSAAIGGPEYLASLCREAVS